MPPATQPAVTPITGPTFTVVREGGGEPLLAALSPDGTQAVVWEAHTAVSVWAVLPGVLAWVSFIILLITALWVAIRLIWSLHRNLWRTVGMRYCQRCGYPCNHEAWQQLPRCSECGSEEAPPHEFSAWLRDCNKRPLLALLVIGVSSVLMGKWSEWTKNSDRWPSVTLWETIESLGLDDWQWREFRVSELVVYEVRTGHRVRHLDLPGRYRTWLAGWSRAATNNVPVDALVFGPGWINCIHRTYFPETMETALVFTSWSRDTGRRVVESHAKVSDVIAGRSPLWHDREAIETWEPTDSSRWPLPGESVVIESAPSGYQFKRDALERANIRIQIHTQVKQPHVVVYDVLLEEVVAAYWRPWVLTSRLSDFAMQISADGKRMIVADGVLLYVHDAP